MHKPANSCMNRLPLLQILFSSLMLGASLSFAPHDANSFDTFETQCSLSVTNNTSQTIYQLYILPSSASESHPGWKFNQLNRPLGVGESAGINIKTTRDVVYWAAYGVLRNNRLYYISNANAEVEGSPTGFVFLNNPDCDRSNFKYSGWSFGEFSDGGSLGVR